MADSAEGAEHGLEDLAARAAGGVGDEADAAGIALARRVVKLWRGCAQGAPSSSSWPPSSKLAGGGGRWVAG
jgi:hypothetical protein